MVTLQDVVGQGIPAFLQYGAIGLVAVVAIAWGWVERTERIKIQDEKNKLYDERNNTQAQLDRILEELKYMDR
jgi:hypothetical protein